MNDYYQLKKEELESLCKGEEVVVFTDSDIQFTISPPEELEATNA